MCRFTPSRVVWAACWLLRAVCPLQQASKGRHSKKGAHVTFHEPWVGGDMVQLKWVSFVPQLLAPNCGGFLTASSGGCLHGACAQCWRAPTPARSSATGISMSNEPNAHWELELEEATTEQDGREEQHLSLRCSRWRW